MDPFIGEIRIFGGNFAPQGWAFCNGQLLSISQNTALFSILGTTYGGNGQTNFVLPNLQGSVPIGAGQAPGLSLRNLGETGGSTTVTLNAATLPAHTHTAGCDTATGGKETPTNNTWGTGGRGSPAAYAASPADKLMSPQALAAAGGSQPHNNLQPFLGLSFIIALQGVFPPRS